MNGFLWFLVFDLLGCAVGSVGVLLYDLFHRYVGDKRVK